MKPVARIQYGSESFTLYPNGNIGRPEIGMGPSGEWRIVGATEYDNFGNIRRTYTLAEILRGRVDSAGGWRYKNGKQRTFVMDFDHGARREWRSPQHRIVLL